MRILFITQFLPYPPDIGGKIKTWRVLKLLSKNHEIFLVSFVDQKKDLVYEKKFKRICRLGVETFVAPVITAKHKRLTQKAILGAFKPIPFRIRKYFLPETADFIEKITQKTNFGAIYCDHLTSSQYLPFIKNLADKLKIYDEHNISSEAMFTYAQSGKGYLSKIGYFGEGIKFWFYEKREIPKFDLIFAISEKDKKRLMKLRGKQGKIFFLPTPFKVRPVFKFGSKVILFVGLMSWWPNEEAALWFAHEIFPLIQKKVPESEFWVIGDNPSVKIKALGRNKQIKVWGYVENINVHYQKTGVVVVPIRSGGGIRIKILDALAHGLPIVGTQMAATGVKLKNNREIIFGKNPQAFARAVIRVLGDKKKALFLSREGSKFIVKDYCWEKAKQVLDHLEAVNENKNINS